VPEIKDGYLIMPDDPGWGTEPNEEAIRLRPPIKAGGLTDQHKAAYTTAS